jgi:hypothetical protein
LTGSGKRRHRFPSNDAGGSANHPFTNAFKKNRVEADAAYHFVSSPLDVVFSDHAKLIAQNPNP